MSSWAPFASITVISFLAADQSLASTCSGSAEPSIQLGTFQLAIYRNFLTMPSAAMPYTEKSTKLKSGLFGNKFLN